MFVPKRGGREKAHASKREKKKTRQRKGNESMNGIESKNRKRWVGANTVCVLKNFVKALYHRATLQEIQDTSGIENAKCDMAIERPHNFLCFFTCTLAFVDFIFICSFLCLFLQSRMKYNLQNTETVHLHLQLIVLYPN